MVMTASHVIGFNGWSPKMLRARFGFMYRPEDKKTAKGETIDFVSNGMVVATSPVQELDVSILRLTANAGLKSALGDDKPRGWVELNNSSCQLESGNPLAVLQHANAGPLKLALNTDSIVNLNDGYLGRHRDDPAWQRRFLHRTDTLPGSSGAPCFDIEWNFAGIHQGRAPGDDFACNFGIPSAAVTDWIKSIGLWELFLKAPPSHDIFAFKSTSYEADNMKLPADVRARLNRRRTGARNKRNGVQ